MAQTEQSNVSTGPRRGDERRCIAFSSEIRTISERAEPNARSAAEASALKVPALLAMWQDKGGSFNSINVGALLLHLSRHCAASFTRIDQSVLEDLGKWVAANKDDFNLRALGDAVYGLAIMGAPIAPAFDAAAQRTIAILQTGDESLIDRRALGTIAAAFGHARHPHQALFSAIDDCAMRSPWDGRESTRLLWAHGELGLSNAPLFKKIRGEIRPAISALELQCLADLIAGHAALGVVNDDFKQISKEVAAEAAARIRADLNRQGGTQRREFKDSPSVLGHVGRLARAFTRPEVCGGRSAPAPIAAFLNAAADYAVVHVQAAAGDDLAALRRALARCGIAHAPLAEAAIGMSKHQLRQCGTEDLAGLLTALEVDKNREAKASGPKPLAGDEVLFIRKVIGEAHRNIEGFRGDAESMTCFSRALAALNVTDEEGLFLRHLGDIIVEDIGLFSLVQLSTVVKAYTDLNVPHPRLYDIAALEAGVKLWGADEKETTDALGAFSFAYSDRPELLRRYFLVPAAGSLTVHPETWRTRGQALGQVWTSWCHAQVRTCIAAYRDFFSAALGGHTTARVPTVMEKQIADTARELNLRIETNVPALPEAVPIVFYDGDKAIAVLCIEAWRDRVGGRPTGELRTGAAAAERVVREAGFRTILKITDSDWNKVEPDQRGDWLATKLQIQ